MAAPRLEARAYSGPSYTTLLTPLFGSRLSHSRTSSPRPAGHLVWTSLFAVARDVQRNISSTGSHRSRRFYSLSRET